jgi:hypothetical protein
MFPPTNSARTPSLFQAQRRIHWHRPNCHPQISLANKRRTIHTDICRCRSAQKSRALRGSGGRLAGQPWHRSVTSQDRSLHLLRLATETKKPKENRKQEPKTTGKPNNQKKPKKTKNLAIGSRAVYNPLGFAETPAREWEETWLRSILILFDIYETRVGSGLAEFLPANRRGTGVSPQFRVCSLSDEVYYRP